MVLMVKKGIVVCLHARKAGIREEYVDYCQGGWVVRCGFSVKVRIEGFVFWKTLGVVSYVGDRSWVLV